jgi:glutaredoxin
MVADIKQRREMMKTEKNLKKEVLIWQITSGVLAVVLILSIITDGFKPKSTAPDIQEMQQAASSLQQLTGSADPGDKDQLAKCLTEKGVVMYGAEWCGYCKKQKEAFGTSFQYINYVDCDKNRDDCSAAGVQGFPTWSINGQNYPGLQDLGTLKSIAGC